MLNYKKLTRKNDNASVIIKVLKIKHDLLIMIINRDASPTSSLRRYNINELNH